MTYTVYSYDTPQWTVKLAELDTQQVIVKKLWTAYLFRRSDEIFSPWILCKQVTFVSSFMPQTLYFHVFRWIPGETLIFCEIKFGHKKYPHPLNQNALP